MESMIQFLRQKYNPLGMIVYGSFASATNNLGSDFDAMLIWDGAEQLHDHSIVNGTQLDVFLYPRAMFEGEYDIEEFIRVWDGLIVFDDTGLIHEIKEKAGAQVLGYPGKSREENQRNLAWCEKMLGRIRRRDMEGLYRLHWLLVDSLEIYFDLKGLYYFGPKKAIRQMQDTDPVSGELYHRALAESTEENINAWIQRLKSL